MIRNIIFDWSGTLVDDLPAVWQATNYVLAQAERPEMSLEQFRAEFCLPFTIFYDRHVPHVPLPQLEDWFHSRFRQVQDSVCALPHAREFLEFCRARKLRTFLLSTVHRDHFAVQSASHGLRPLSRQAVRERLGQAGEDPRDPGGERPGAGRDAVHRRHAARHRDGPARRHSFLRGADRATTRWSNCARRSRT